MLKEIKELYKTHKHPCIKQILKLLEGKREIRFWKISILF